MRLLSNLGAFEAFHDNDIFAIQFLGNGSKLTDITPPEIDDLITFLQELKKKEFDKS